MKKSFSNCSTVGKLMVLIGAFVIAPLIVLPWFPQDAGYWLDFLLPGGASMALGLLICLFGKGDSGQPASWKASVGKYSLTVLFAWGWGVLIGALPFKLSGQLTMVQGLFEAVSGWTTTGLSAMDVSITPAIFLFHRSFMQYCGGLGFIMVMILFISNKHAMGLYSAEGHPDKIMPNIKKTAQAIFIIYNLCLVLGSTAYRIVGMPWFDGICHAMCALSTGGFSTKLGSIGEYNSLPIEIITIVLMIIGTTNFAALLLLAKGHVRSFFRVSEVRFMFLVFLLTIPPTALSLAHGLGMSYGEGFRRASFDIVSALSTSGFASMSYTDWPQFAIGMLILVMLIGGGIGSTAGGIKLSRVYLLIRMAICNIHKRLTPARTIEAPYYVKATGREPINRELEEDTTGFVVCYLFLFFVCSMLITLTADCTLTEAMFDFASSIGTVGLSIGITGPATNAPTLIIEMVGMLMGRLEIFIVLVGVNFGVGMLRDAIRRVRK